MIKVEVHGKNRVIKDKFIYHHTVNDLECEYKNHHINIAAQETGGWYASVRDQKGIYVVLGDFGGEYGVCKSLMDVLIVCIENIL